MTGTTDSNRARDLGIPFDGTPGKFNAITDVPGVEVGYSTVIFGEPEDYKSYSSPFARTGVTAILPSGKGPSAVAAGLHSLNANGELTGALFIEDYGHFRGPIMLTNTGSVGVVRDAVYQLLFEKDWFYPYVMGGEPVEGAAVLYPVVGETYDGFINNLNGHHVKAEHAREAIETAGSGSVAEGCVGGGTGMQAHLFKGGSGTASRVLTIEQDEYTLGVFVQANHGTREAFQIRGVPIGPEIVDCDPVLNGIAPGGNGLNLKPGTGSIIVIVATDAPLDSIQLRKLAKRVPIGIGLLGGGCEDGSGDIFLAFSTANAGASLVGHEVTTRTSLPHDALDRLFSAVVQATEEAILNAMTAATTTIGINGNTLFALPQDQVRAILKDRGIIPS